MVWPSPSDRISFIFFFNATATTEIYTLSLHDALPILAPARREERVHVRRDVRRALGARPRSEEHTSELQSLRHLVCRLLLEKKNTNVHAAYRLAAHRGEVTPGLQTHSARLSTARSTYR